MIGRQEHGSAVDAAAEADAERFLRRQMSQPPGNLVCEPPDVDAPNLFKVCREPGGARTKEPKIGRIRIRTTHELNLDHIMRRNHARVAGMELVLESGASEPGVNHVDSVSDDQGGTFLSFREEVAH